MVLQRRKKQIKYGKNTEDYTTYIQKVPKNDRSSEMPRTPDIHKIYSRRRWDDKVRKWKIYIHKFSSVQLDAGAHCSEKPAVAESVLSWADEVEEEEARNKFTVQAALKYDEDEEGENPVLEISSDKDFRGVYSEKDTEEKASTAAAIGVIVNESFADKEEDDDAANVAAAALMNEQKNQDSDRLDEEGNEAAEALQEII